MTAPLDVLAVMDSASVHLIHPDCDQMRQARAAVAELVEADKAYDAARAKYGSENHWESPQEAARARFAVSAAASRRAAALAKFGGAA